jgi:acyl-CoA thioesterase
MSEVKSASRAWTWLGLQTVETAEGTATVEMKAREDMANHSGFVHGGMISTLADSAMGLSVRTLKPGVVRSMSFDLKLSFISAARIGETLRATGRVIHAGRRTVVTECRVEGPDGKLVATASGTFSVTREKEYSSSAPSHQSPPKGGEDKEQT